MDIQALLILASLHTKPQQPVAQTKKPMQVAMACFFQGEQVSGTNKICYYSCLGDTVAINVSFTSLCPLTINK